MMKGGFGMLTHLVSFVLFVLTTGAMNYLSGLLDSSFLTLITYVMALGIPLIFPLPLFLLYYLLGIVRF